jgi:FlaA1/EpsC-like NDP-sugar epimerase
MTVRDEQNARGDIEIVYVGLRPGEKLYEELFVGQASSATEHSRIHKAAERYLLLGELQSHIDDLKSAISAADPAAVRAILQELIAADKGGLEDANLQSAAVGA